MHAECRDNGQAERDAEHSYGIETAGIRSQRGLFPRAGRVCQKPQCGSNYIILKPLGGVTYRSRKRELLVGRELGEGVWRGLLKACEPAAKDKTYFVRGPVALLGDLDFSLIALLRRGVHF
jgi:hypothetical protein